MPALAREATPGIKTPKFIEKLRKLATFNEIGLPTRLFKYLKELFISACVNLMAANAFWWWASALAFAEASQPPELPVGAASRLNQTLSP